MKASSVFTLIITILVQVTLTVQQDCSAANLCPSGCCSKSGYCGYGPDYCGYVLRTLAWKFSSILTTVAMVAKVPVNVNRSAILDGVVTNGVMLLNVHSRSAAASMYLFIHRYAAMLQAEVD
jgi:hypothetical protein